MDINDFKALTGALMREHGLLERGWTQVLDNSVQRFGLCNYRTKRLSFSRHLVQLNGIERCRDAILHEIAHALVGPGAGHGPVWRAMCRKIGAKPERCYSAATTVTVPDRWVGTCPNCASTVGRQRLAESIRTRSACTKCCNRYNRGRFDRRFLLTWRENR